MKRDTQSKNPSVQAHVREDAEKRDNLDVQSFKPLDLDIGDEKENDDDVDDSSDDDDEEDQNVVPVINEDDEFDDGDAAMQVAGGDDVIRSSKYIAGQAYRCPACARLFSLHTHKWGQFLEHIKNEHPKTPKPNRKDPGIITRVDAAGNATARYGKITGQVGFTQDDWSLLKKAHVRAAEYARKMRRVAWECRVLRPKPNSLGETILTVYNDKLDSSVPELEDRDEEGAQGLDDYLSSDAVRQRDMLRAKTAYQLFGGIGKGEQSVYDFEGGALDAYQELQHPTDQSFAKILAYYGVHYINDYVNMAQQGHFIANLRDQNALQSTQQYMGQLIQQHGFLTFSHIQSCLDTVAHQNRTNSAQVLNSPLGNLFKSLIQMSYIVDATLQVAFAHAPMLTFSDLKASIQGNHSIRDDVDTLDALGDL